MSKRRVRERAGSATRSGHSGSSVVFAVVTVDRLSLVFTDEQVDGQDEENGLYSFVDPTEHRFGHANEDPEDGHDADVHRPDEIQDRGPEFGEEHDETHEQANRQQGEHALPVTTERAK